MNHEYLIHTRETAPEASRELLDEVQSAYGRIPNIIGALSESPAALRSLMAMSHALEISEFSPLEVQLVSLVVSWENQCEYCIAAHSSGVDRNGADDLLLASLRRGEKVEDARLEVLRKTALAVHSTRGNLRPREVDAFLAKFSKAQLADLYVIVAMKTLTNYANHLMQVPLDTALEPYSLAADDR